MFNLGASELSDHSDRRQRLFSHCRGWLGLARDSADAEAEGRTGIKWQQDSEELAQGQASAPSTAISASSESRKPETRAGVGKVGFPLLHQGAVRLHDGPDAEGRHRGRHDKACAAQFVRATPLISGLGVYLQGLRQHRGLDSRGTAPVVRGGEGIDLHPSGSLPGVP